MRGSVKVLMASVAMAIVALALLADISAAEQGTAEILLPSQGAELVTTLGGKPSCCDKCLCTKSMPPTCRCTDQMDFRCDRSCQDCYQLPIKIYPPKFVCKDTFKELCGDPCPVQYLV